MKCNQLEEKVQRVRRGYQWWVGFLNKYSLTSGDYVIAFPHGKDDINACALKYLRKLCTYGNVDKVIVLCTKGNKQELSRKGEAASLQIELTEHEMECLLDAYSIIDFSPHFIVMSMTLPVGRNGDKVISNNGLTLDEVVALGILKMPVSALEI